MSKLVDMYDLLWIVGGKVKEVIETNKPIAVCKWRANNLKQSTHQVGLLQPRRVALRPKTGWI